MVAVPLARRSVTEPDLEVGLDRVGVETGLDHVGWVRVTVHADESRSYEVVGTAHRRPSARPITVQTAGRLLEAGIRAVVRSCPECGG